jgi:heptosyltransferase-2/heptosyltransferase-3
LLHGGGIGDAPYIVLHPGSGSALKSWPLERFAAVGADLSRTLHVRVAVTGSAAERQFAAALCAALPLGSLNLAGCLSWGELESLLGRAVLVAGVDSGPLHLAVAAGTPSVALFGPADPAQFAPWGSSPRHQVVTAHLPCRPCRRLDYCRIAPGHEGPPPCMMAIDDRQVLAAVQAAIAAGRH